MTTSSERLLAELRRRPNDAQFADAMKVAEHFFGAPRRNGSHRVFKMPWPGDPRVNLQMSGNGKAKGYQVRQILTAVDRLELEAARAAGEDDI